MVDAGLLHEKELKIEKLKDKLTYVHMTYLSNKCIRTKKVVAALTHT